MALPVGKVSPKTNLTPFREYVQEQIPKFRAGFRLILMRFIRRLPHHVLMINSQNNGHHVHPVKDVCFDAALIRRYGGRGPRYTSYPTALQFSEAFTVADYRHHAALSNQSRHPLSLYVHIPFCQSLCYYCACNKVVTRNEDRITRYLEHLEREIEMQAELFDDHRIVEQLHFGGGTPTYLGDHQLRKLMGKLRQEFNLDASDEREFSIEVDPRSVHDSTIALLAELGFNRLSLGVQDFDSAVQIAVNRLQTADDVSAIVKDARRYGFKSVSFDLIYGLPHQTVSSFDKTLDRVIAMRPDRLAIYNYAHLPNRFKGQRMIKDADLPGPATKLRVLHHTIDKLSAADYCYIGMDHFAVASDDLVQAQRSGTLQRNFQGYSTHGDCDLVALGASAISHIGDSYAQNATSTLDYEEQIGLQQLAINRGIAVDEDDRLRASIIQELMCHDRFDIRKFERDHQIDFSHRFVSELDQLAVLHDDGLIEMDSDGIQISPKGRLLLRSIAMIFDRYLPAASDASRFSRAI